MNCKAGRDSSLREDIKCFTDVLSEEGYDIGYIGKYHLDMPEIHFDKEGNYVGEGGGFYFDGSSYGSESCWDMVTPPGSKRHGVNFWYSYGTANIHNDPHYWDNDCIRHEPKEWSPKHEAKAAAKYILNTDGQRDSAKPFCLFVAMNPPRSPYSSVENTDEEVFRKYYDYDVVEDTNKLLGRIPKGFSDSISVEQSDRT